MSLNRFSKYEGYFNFDIQVLNFFPSMGGGEKLLTVAIHQSFFVSQNIFTLLLPGTFYIDENIWLNQRRGLLTCWTGYVGIQQRRY